MVDKKAIRKQALELIARDGRGVPAQLVARFGLSRQAVHGHLQALMREGLIKGEGSTKARVYSLATLEERTRSYTRDGLREDVVWRELFLPVLNDLPDNVVDIWHYGVTEMVNNAIDHSGSAQVHVGLQRNACRVDGWVADDGEGIFLKIQRALDLYDPREAILELAKGKLTTDPDRHTGEGIFFTSRVFDGFEIRSGELHFSHNEDMQDVLSAQASHAPGTLVLMRLSNDSKRTLQAVFDRFAGPEEYTFATTLVPVRLAQYEGEKLVSRSQAKRLYQRFERFRHVQLDFAGVSEIGQAFADELFRVFTRAHPSVKLEPINMSKGVTRMVKRVEGRED